MTPVATRASSAVGSPAWKRSIPKHLRRDLATALAALDDNRLGEAMIAFGACCDAAMAAHPGATEPPPEIRPVLYFGAQGAKAAYFQLRGERPDSPELDQWRQCAEDLTMAHMEMSPADAVAAHNAATFLQDLGRDADALTLYRRAASLDAGLSETWGNMGTLYYQLGDVARAWGCWDQCLRTPTTGGMAAVNQAYIHLRKGEYAEGWAKYNQRWQDIEFVRGYGRRDLSERKHWIGGTLPKSHRLYLHGEQGLGDHIQFARYVPVLQSMGYRIVGLETRSVLRRWMEASYPDVPIYVRDEEPPPAFSHHCSTMDLPGILGTTMETIPHLVRPIPEPMRRVYVSASERRIGIAWQGATGNPSDSQRSIPADQLWHLADIPGVTWVSLQFGDNGAMVARSWLNAQDGTKGCADALDTAAVMRGLDLVVTVDTATAHMAGTLGVPTLLLHRFCREWRWGDITVTGERCPWYPSVRSLTQSRPSDWEELLLRVRAELSR